MVRYVICPDEDIWYIWSDNARQRMTLILNVFICFVNSEIINQIVMELVVIEKHAYLQLKLQIESLSAQIESVKKKIGPVEMEK